MSHQPHQPHHPHQPNHANQAGHASHNQPSQSQPRTIPEGLAPGDQANSVTRLPTDRHEQPNSDRIRLRAYEISQSRNGGPGDAMADWIQAEQDVTSLRVPKR
jgi:hypothetical protein